MPQRPRNRALGELVMQLPRYKKQNGCRAYKNPAENGEGSLERDDG